MLISRCTAFSYLEGDPELAYFAIYDGHGGTGVAKGRWVGALLNTDGGLRCGAGSA